MSDRAKYRDLCKEEPTVPIFSQDWWLDAVCRETNWDVVILEKGNEIHASLPYYFKKKSGSLNIQMPLLTPRMGPWLRPSQAQKYHTKLSNEMEYLTKLIEALPRFKSFDQMFHYSITNWLPFYWDGFEQTTRYTYIFPDLTDLDKIYNGIDHGVRKYISKSSGFIDVVDSEDLRKFYEINTEVFTKQGRKTPYSHEFIDRLDAACRRQGKRRLLFAVDKKEEIHSALYIVWSGDSTYALMSGINPDFQNDGTLRLLFWEAIKHASTVAKCFDFEGSMLKPIERNFRKFGPLQVPYLRVFKRVTFRNRLFKQASNLKNGLLNYSNDGLENEGGG